MNAPVITIKTSDFRRLVSPVIPLAARGYDLPILNAVLLRTSGKYLTAVATDRFRMGVQRVGLAEDLPPLNAVVPLASLRSILAVFKATRASDPELVMSFEKDRVTITAGGSLGFLDARMSWPVEGGTFPAVDGIIRDAFTRVDASPLALNPALLADFRHAQTRGQHMELWGTAGQAVAVRVGEDFLGVIMPMRSESGVRQELTDGWDAILAAPAEPKGKKEKVA